MNSVGLQREIRRAVTTLLDNPIEDIELVWHALSAREQERLRPVMTAASGMTDKACALFSVAPALDAGRIAPLIEAMPDMLAARLLACLDDNARRALSARLPDTRLRAIHAHHDVDSVTLRTREAWLAACLAQCADTAGDDVCARHDLSRGKLAARIRRLFGKTFRRSA